MALNGAGVGGTIFRRQDFDSEEWEALQSKLRRCEVWAAAAKVTTPEVLEDIQKSGLSPGGHGSSSSRRSTFSAGRRKEGELAGTTDPERKRHTENFSVSGFAQRNQGLSEVPMNEIKNIIAVMKEGRGDRQLRATIAVTNILPDSPSNRQNAMAAGLLDILVGMLIGYDQDKRLARLAVACLSNLSAEASLKNSIVMAGVVPLVSRHLESSGSKEGRAASAHAAATLWSLCIDSLENKRKVASTGQTLSRLVQLLLSSDPTIRTQGCGCVGELCVGDDVELKDELFAMGVIPLFISALGQPDHELQHLASVAICNMCANNARNKAEARDFGAVEIFCNLIRDNERLEHVRDAAAGGLYNVASRDDRSTVESSGVLQLLQKYTGPHYKLIHRRVMGSGVPSSAPASGNHSSSARRKSEDAAAVSVATGGGAAFNVKEC